MEFQRLNELRDDTKSRRFTERKVWLKALCVKVQKGLKEYKIKQDRNVEEFLAKQSTMF